MAVIGATQLEPVNVLGSYVQGLEAGRGARKQRVADEAALALRNYLASAPDLSTPEAQNKLISFGKPGLDILTGQAELASKRATTKKTDLEIAAKQGEIIAQEAGAFLTDPSLLNKTSIDAWAQGAVQRGILSQDAYARFQQLPDDPATLGPAMQRLAAQGMTLAEQTKFYRPEGKLQEVGGVIVTVDPYTGKEIGSVDYSAAEQAARAAGAARTTITMPSEKEFSGAIGKAAAGRLDKYRDNADSAVRTLETSRQLAPLLDDPKFISGTFADAKLALARAAGIDVASTEAYFAAIGQQVAERITAFGAGTGLSDADREFAKSIAGGNPVTTAEGIRRIIRINNESARSVINKYNTERNRLGEKSPEVLDYYPEISVSRQIKRTGTLNGRRVVEYDDGSVEYAD